MFGVLLAAARAHNPVVDRRGQMVLGQIGFLIVINLVISFTPGAGIDYMAHIGGLVAGIWLGFVIVPGRVPTLSSMWQRPAGSAGGRPPALALIGVLGLVAIIVFGVMIGTEMRRPGGVVGAPGTAGLVEDHRTT
jgi:hypothetical protein